MKSFILYAILVSIPMLISLAAMAGEGGA